MGGFPLPGIGPFLGEPTDLEVMYKEMFRKMTKYLTNTVPNVI